MSWFDKIGKLKKSNEAAGGVSPAKTKSQMDVMKYGTKEEKEKAAAEARKRLLERARALQSK